VGGAAYLRILWVVSYVCFGRCIRADGEETHVQRPRARFFLHGNGVCCGVPAMHPQTSQFLIQDTYLDDRIASPAQLHGYSLAVVDAVWMQTHQTGSNPPASEANTAVKHITKHTTADECLHWLSAWPRTTTLTSLLRGHFATDRQLVASTW
jgi:hypothetical protein